jgi:hypothetical protein
MIVGLLANATRAYVYSYPEMISLGDPTGEAFAAVPVGPNPPADMQSVFAIAMLTSTISVTGKTPASDAGYVQSSKYEAYPEPPAVVIEAPVAFPLFPNAAVLSPGDTIGPNSLWGFAAWVGGYSSPGDTVGDPAFLSPNSAYVGIEFPDANSQIHYGWLLVRYDQSAGTYFGTIDLLEAAYETDPGVPITIAPEPTVPGFALGILVAIQKFCSRRRKVLPDSFQ